MLMHNNQLGSLVKDRYSLADVQRLSDTLRSQGVLDFPCLDNGLFPAAIVTGATAYTGYANVWVRDNVHIAHAHHLVGQTEVAVRTVGTLMSFFQTQRPRFEAIIRGDADPEDVMNRPHIRFDGQTLTEIDQKWSHAQNDALGYFLWLYCRLIREGRIQTAQPDQEMLGLFPRYFEAIQFWQDEDSGHWEERRKISASSIGTVVAGLRELSKLINGNYLRYGTAVSVDSRDLVDRLIAAGESSLRDILPWECVQPDAAKNRRFDSALLFLIFPLEVVDAAMAGRILADVAGHLQGEYGIRRYLGDSFWSPDYKHNLAQELRTAAVGDDMAWRDALARQGCEAQWCIFDPIISAVYGRQYQVSRDPRLLEMQTRYVNRAFGQITGEASVRPPWRCPELYYIEGGRYVANDATPLLWTQANLMMAMKILCDSAGLENEPGRAGWPGEQR
ncbi:MAG: glycoside hydrolase family 15 protein [Tepidisphaeraceae bacterium]|jgi:phosphorylase kinase alpha/beta subunit